VHDARPVKRMLTPSHNVPHHRESFRRSTKKAADIVLSCLARYYKHRTHRACRSESEAGRRGSSEDDPPLRFTTPETVATDGV
jgi:hypothetical protein